MLARTLLHSLRPTGVLRGRGLSSCRCLSSSSAAASSSSSSSREPAHEAKFPTNVAMQTRLLINGDLVPALSGETFATVNPGNGEELAQVASAQAEDVDAAVQAATRALYEGPWGTSMTGHDRGSCLYRLAELIEEHAEELRVLESLDNGKSITMSTNVDVPASAHILRYYAGWANKITGKHIPVGPDFLCYTRHEPVGVVGAIIPWNLPLIGVAAKLGPALACGNTMLLKPAEQTPLTALRVAELSLEAGFPDGVINVLSGFGHTAGNAMVEHPNIDKIAFTGSVEVGKHIQRTAANTLKRTTLELGGKNPNIVFADADIGLALDNVHNGLFWNKGEACAAGSRIFVEESIFDEFVEQAAERARGWKVGNPFSEDTDQGAQCSQEQFDKIMGYIETGVNEGATLLAGGKRVGTQGFYVEPTVFTDVRDDMRIFSEEIFGPVMTINKFRDVDDVIRRANNSEYGLAAGVFTKDVEKGHLVASKMRSGMVFWNCYHVVDVSAPFGGFKQSGFGREGGEYGIMPYLEVKNVVMRVRS